MKTRMEVLEEVMERGVGFDKKKPKMNQKTKAEAFMEEADKHDYDAAFMHQKMNTMGSIDGYTAELLSAAIREWKQQA